MEGGFSRCAPPSPLDDLQLSNTTGILLFACKICLRHQSDTPFRVVHPLLRKTLDLVFVCSMDKQSVLRKVDCEIY